MHVYNDMVHTKKIVWTFSVPLLCQYFKEDTVLLSVLTVRYD